MLWSESTIILAIIGMVGLFSTAVIWQRSNRITSNYYGKWTLQTSGKQATGSAKTKEGANP